MAYGKTFFSCTYYDSLIKMILRLCNMKKIISIFINTQGVFADSTSRSSLTSDIIGQPLVYTSFECDKKNIRSDKQRFFSDFRKAINEAKSL